jgi:hypothetical protein
MPVKMSECDNCSREMSVEDLTDHRGEWLCSKCEDELGVNDEEFDDEEDDDDDEVYRECRKQLAEEDCELINHNDEKGIETEMKIQNRHLRWLLHLDDDEETSKIVQQKVIKMILGR